MKKIYFSPFEVKKKKRKNSKMNEKNQICMQKEFSKLKQETRRKKGKGENERKEKHKKKREERKGKGGKIKNKK